MRYLYEGDGSSTATLHRNITEVFMVIGDGPELNFRIYLHPDGHRTPAKYA